MTHLIRPVVLTTASLLLAIGLFSCNAVPNAPEQRRAITLPLDIDPGANFILSINNESSYRIGPVAITGVNGSQNITIDSVGIYNDTLAFIPLNVTVNGVVCPVQDTTIVPLPLGKVSVQSKDPGLIEIIDYSAQD